VVLLSQTEVGEVREGGDRGGSSTMPHKRNPVAAISALAGARQAPALVASLLAAMEHEHERAAGAWHAEWAPLRELLVATGSAAAWLQDCLAHLEVDAERMRSNLDDAVLAERVARALARVLGRDAADEAVRTALAERRPLALAAREHLPSEDVDRLLDPATYLGANDALIDRALEAHRR
jgi:3-carboxy-cis,cis-muconate cycloisomerase